MKKNILIASNLYKPNIGGVENSLGHMAHSYAQQGHNVIIFASDISRLAQALPEVEHEGKVTIMRYKVAAFSGVRRYLMHWVNGIKLLALIQKSHTPDLVISRFHLSCLMLSLAGYKHYIYLVPGVVKFQNAFLKKKVGLSANILGYANYSLNCWLQLQAFKRCSALYVFSENMYSQVTSVASNVQPKMGITKPGVDPGRFKVSTFEQKLAGRASLGIWTEAPVFLCIGRLVKDKGFDLVIQAMAKLTDSQAKLWIVGEGAEMTQLKALVTEQSLSQQVLFVAGTDQPEAYFSVADFFVMSSRYEPLGQTVLEALASGLPVVAFKNTGDIVTATQELLGEQGALYAQSADPASLAVAMDAAVATMHTEDYTKSCEQNRLLAENKFAWQTLCDDLLVAQHHD